MAAGIATARSPFGPLSLRRSQNVVLAVAMGSLVGLLMLVLPMQAALASSVVGAFVILALVDTRVAVFALLLVRATMDITATVPLLSAAGSSNVNAAAMMSLLVVGLAFGHLALARVNIMRMPLVKLWLAFLAVAFVGIPLAPEPARAVQDFMRVAGVFALYVLVVDVIRTREDLRWLLRVMLLSMVVPLALGLYQYVTGAGNQETEGFNRILGTFTHPSPYASYLVTLLPFAFVSLLHTTSRPARLALAIVIPLMVFSIYATQTRVAWIGFVVLAMVFMWDRARWTLIFVPLVALALFFGMSSMRERFNEATSETGSVFWRAEQWQRAVEIPSPPQLITVGAGLGAVDVTLGNFTHNEYIRLLAETGAIGLTITLVLYWKLFTLAREGYRRVGDAYERDLMLALLMALAARAVIAGSDNIIAFPVLEWYFWGFAAVTVIMSGRYRELREPVGAPPQRAHDAPAARQAIPSPGVP
jgi:O-antigen ligase